MSEEVLDNVDNAQVDEVEVGSSAETENTEDTPVIQETKEEHMIPKSRFDEINERYKTLKAQMDEIEQAKKQAEIDAKKQAGEYKDLYEKLEAELEQQRIANEQLRMDSLRKEVAAKHGYGFLWDRLRGETELELEADLQSLISELPAPKAPSVDGSAGGGDRKPGQEPLTDAERRELAARLNIPVQYITDNALS